MTDTPSDDVLAELDLDPNEASGLLRVCDPALLEQNGWDHGFWAVLDEVDVADCIVLLGHRSGEPLADAWQVERLHVDRAGDDGEAKDAEAVAAHDGWVYIFGSHHGGKSGPLRIGEQWVARFREAAVADPRATPRVDVANDAFRLHRLLNDHLRDHDLLPLREQTRAAFIDATIAELADTPHAALVRPDDWTINIEGADVTAEGALLLGLRFPVTADGRPIVVQLDDWQRLFDEPHGLPSVSCIWEIDAVGRNGTLAGIRDLCTVGDELHVVSGDLDSAGKGSVIRKEYEEGTQTVSTHFVTALSAGGGGRVGATVVKEFPDNPRIEGIATDGDGRFFYVSDEDESISVRMTPVLTGSV